MFKISLSFFSALLLTFATTNNEELLKKQKVATTVRKGPDYPADLQVTNFAGPDLTPSPACLAVAPTGEVFVGVDKQGSLGKKPNLGSIIRLVDSDNDGKVDQHTTFAQVDNPRGIFAVGNQVFVLHAVFSPETGKASGMNLVVFDDKNEDGVADGPSKPLIENISNTAFIQQRGVDHATNGIRIKS